MKQTYPPLALLQNFDMNSFQRVRDELVSCGAPIDSWSERDMIRYVTSYLFMRQSRELNVPDDWKWKHLLVTDKRLKETYMKTNSVLDNKLRRIESHLQDELDIRTETSDYALSPTLFDGRQEFDEDLADYLLLTEPNSDSHYNLRTDIMSYYLTLILFERWLKNKQVYKLDEDFAYTLNNTNHLEISRHAFSHLPYQSFYVDLSSCKRYVPVIGAFVFVEAFPDRVSLDFYHLMDNLSSCYLHCNGYYDANGIAEFYFEDAENIDYQTNNITEGALENMYDGFLGTNKKTLPALLLQLICYLSQDEPQITESDLTKGTYRPRAEGAPVRNKWSEVHISDVGVRFGNKFRKWKKEIEQAEEGAPHTCHRSPKPHFRSAHWHKYWTGVGRNIPKYNWIEPVFVGYGDSVDTVIHVVDDQ